MGSTGSWRVVLHGELAFRRDLGAALGGGAGGARDVVVDVCSDPAAVLDAIRARLGEGLAVAAAFLERDGVAEDLVPRILDLDPTIEVVLVCTGGSARAASLRVPPPARCLELSGSGAPETFREYVLDLCEAWERRRHATAAAASGSDDARLLRAIEQLGEMIVLTDTDGIIRYVNEAFTQVTGFGRDEVLGRSTSILRSPEHEETFVRDMRRRLEAGETWTGRMISQGSGDKTFEEQATITPVRNGGGEIVDHIAVRRDVTLDAALEEKARQKQRMEVLGTLAGGICHEFNNLLTVIGGYANLIEQSVDSSDQLHQYAREVGRTSVRASSLTRQLLAFSRRQVMRPQVLDLNTVFEHLKMTLRRILGERIQLVTELSEDLAPVCADATLVEQVLLNLVVNARDAMPDGGRIVVRTGNAEASTGMADPSGDGPDGPHVVLSVIDSGCGMDHETIAHIFEPFFTTKAVGSGTGLGLATVYGIVSQSGGFIRVSSEPGQGSRFDVCLPRVAPEEAKGEEADETTEWRGQGETVLVVEDEDAVRRLAKDALRRAGYRVFVARDGEEALEISRGWDGPIHALLSDVIMPGLRGPALAAAMANLRPEMKVLLMSGYRDGLAPDQDVDLGSLPLIEKPFSPRALARRIRGLLDSR